MPTSHHEKLEQLRKRFLDELPSRINDLESALTSSDRNDALRCAHTLAGTAGTFGLLELGKAAERLESCLSGNAAAKLPELLEEVRHEASAARVTRTPSSSQSKQTEAVFGHGALIALVEDDALLGEHIAEQLMRFGYQSRLYATPDAFLADLNPSTLPCAVVMDITFGTDDMSGTRAVHSLRERGLQHLPVIYMSSRSDFSARLEAVRSGGRAYLVKPLETAALVNLLDTIMRESSTESYRVLIIEDVALLAETYYQILSDAGMEARTLLDPTRTLEALADFNPDLILVDLYMPVCSGTELACVVRQIEAWVSLPIVFLSKENDLDKQMEAMRHGGDDFLTKPVAPEHLVTSVRQRARRHRALRAYMEHDSLTGLLNHSALKERLTIELARAERNQTELAFVMIDLDHFKAVNDTYGHPAGDRVLRSLARLLRERLRRTDIAGRYGGEEFALILPDTSAATAKQVVDDIRRNFSAVLHGSVDNQFNVTLSAGISHHPDYDHPETLAHEADVALYESKHNGRNRVTLASKTAQS